MTGERMLPPTENGSAYTKTGAAMVGGHLFFQKIKLGDDKASIAVELAAGLGNIQFFGKTFKEKNVIMFFQFPYRLGHGGLGHIQIFSGGTHGSRVGHLDKYF